MKRKVLDKYKSLLKPLIKHDMSKQEFANRAGIALNGLCKIPSRHFSPKVLEIIKKHLTSSCSKIIFCPKYIT